MKEEEEATGSNTAVTVVVVIVIICILGTASTILVLKYKAKSPEVTPNIEEEKSGPQAETIVKKQKKKQPSSATGMGKGPSAVNAAKGQGLEEKKKRRRRSSVSPVVGVGSQVQQLKGKKKSSKQVLSKDTLPSKLLNACLSEV